jgi:lipid-A-disaccharide synthase
MVDVSISLMANRHLMVVAGEVSGDIHAGNMLAELRRIVPDVHAFGVGGDRLQAAGLDRVASTGELAHMGLVEVMRELPRIRRIMHRLVDEADRRRPAAAVLVDSPDFNLRLATRLRSFGIPVVLYVSPQLWAWRRRRVKTVQRVAREVLCILPFEVAFYDSHGVRARYVGHPLVDEIARVGLLEGRPRPRPGRVAMLPGSRAMEVRELLPVMLETLQTTPPSIVREAVLVEAPGMAEVVGAMIAESGGDSRLQRVRGEDRRQELASSEVAWTASGTATLECTLLDVPMVVGYRLQPVSYAFAKLLVRVPHVALVNLIVNRKVAPELLQKAWSTDRLRAATSELLEGGAATQREGLAEARARLGGPGASRNAAEAIAEYLR